MLTNTIFDFLIYKGYVMRTVEQQHIPGHPLVGTGFKFEMGLKDMSLMKRRGGGGWVSYDIRIVTARQVPR